MNKEHLVKIDEVDFAIIYISGILVGIGISVLLILTQL